MSKTKIEIQYFRGCPNSDIMINNINEVLGDIDIEYEYYETLVETNEKAIEVKFRGSPTLLVNGKDFEEAPEPEEPSLACRFYKNGVPSSEEILRFIKQKK